MISSAPDAPDLGPLFANQHSDYFYGVEGLDSVLVRNLGAVFTEEEVEAELDHEEQRTLASLNWGGKRWATTVVGPER